MLNKREIEILELLIENDDIDILTLSEKFSVSKRALQYNINNINYYLDKNNFSKISIKNSKFNIDSVDELKKLHLIVNKSDNIVKEDRVYLIYLYSIFNDDGLNISNLSKKINISRNTLKSEMQNINEDFIFLHTKGYILYVDNNKKIEILEEIFKRPSLLKIAKEVLNMSLFDKIEVFLKEISLHLKLNISDEVYRKLLISIYCYIDYPEYDNYDWNDFNLGKDYKLVQNIFKKYFSETTNINFITDMIVGLSLNSKIETWLDESFLVKKMIKQVGEELGINLSLDNILYDFLFSHIKVSIYRLKKNIELDNPIYQKLIWEDDAIIEIVRKAVIEMEEIFEIKFTDVEIYLISYHFKASVERLQSYEKKKVILVCGLGYGTSRLLEYSLKENFDIDIVDVLPAYMVNDGIKNKNIDYILTTVDLEVNSIKISPKLTNNDYEILEKLGIKRKKEKILVDKFLDDIYEEKYLERGELKKLLLNKYSNIFVESFRKENELALILNKEKVFFAEKIDNWKNAIEILGNILEKNGAIDKKYTFEMINMVEKLGPYIVIEDGIAMPHSKTSENVFNTDIAILILKNSVEFDKGKKAKIFFAFSSIDEKSHLKILNSVYNLIIRDNFLKDIENINTYEKFIKYINENN